MCKPFRFLVEVGGEGCLRSLGSETRATKVLAIKQKVPPAYSHAEESACSSNGRRDDEWFFGPSTNGRSSAFGALCLGSNPSGPASLIGTSGDAVSGKARKISAIVIRKSSRPE